MRIWDINPGYLNRQSLLGEHRELHGIVSIIENGKKGYAKHPETVRWAGYGWALGMRHQLLSAEMSLRNFTDRSPVHIDSKNGAWPEEYIDQPYQQFKILEAKYLNKELGRIPLPKNAQELWSQHKYSVLARNENLYRKIDRQVSTMPPDDDFSVIARMLTELLRTQPSAGGIRNALHHMWGYISDCHCLYKCSSDEWSSNRLFNEIQSAVLTIKEPHLMSSTALSELKIWIKMDDERPVSDLNT